MMELTCECGHVAKWYNSESMTLHCDWSKRDAVTDGEPEENFQRLNDAVIPWSVVKEYSK